MEIQEMLELKRPAKKSGGDRYEATNLEDLVIYIPQSISRPKESGIPFSTIRVTFEA